MDTIILQNLLDWRKMAKVRNTETQCPIDKAINILSGKWKLSILRQLTKGIIRFNELQGLLSNITQKTLAQQLRELERDGMIRRNIYPEVPPRVEYSLTLLGESIKPVLDSMCTWGKEYQKMRTEKGT
jgi:DNA-binding HxlR family transcriptional regulator